MRRSKIDTVCAATIAFQYNRSSREIHLHPGATFQNSAIVILEERKHAPKQSARSLLCSGLRRTS